MRIIIILLFCAVQFSATAANYTIQLGNVTWTGGAGGYNCFSSTAYPNTVNFTITKTATGRIKLCRHRRASQNTGNYTRQLRSGGNSLNYALYTTSAMTYQLKAPTTATANEVISGSLSGGSGQVIPLSFIFYIRAGTSCSARHIHRPCHLQHLSRIQQYRDARHHGDHLIFSRSRGGSGRVHRAHGRCLQQFSAAIDPGFWHIAERPGKKL